MAQLTGRPEVFHVDTSSVDTSQQIPLGTRAVDASGNEYIYAKGTASVVAGDWCTFPRSDYAVERSSANDIGYVGIAGTAIVAGQFGWYQIYGLRGGANVATGASGPNPLYLTSTGGRVGTTDVAGDFIVGAFNLAPTAASNSGTVFIKYPFVTDNAIN